MAENYGTDPEKMLDWDKKLGEQSEYVKKAIEPLLTLNFAYTKECMDEGAFSGNFDYKYYLETKNKEDPNFIKEEKINYFSVGDLYDYLSGYYDDDKKPVVEKLKTLGIEGERHGDKIDHVFDYEYIKSIDREAYFEEQQSKMFKEEQKAHELEVDEYLKTLEDELKAAADDEITRRQQENESRMSAEEEEKEDNMSEIFNWNKVTSESLEFGGDWDKCDYLKTHIIDKKEPSYFILEPTKKGLIIGFFPFSSDVLGHKPKFYIDTNNLDIDTAKNIIEKTTEHFSKLEDYKFNDMREHIIKQFPEQTIIIDEWPKTTQASDRERAITQKIGYVQGVCESVLAFNTDENRKIMTEATMTFLSKKLLSEMNVTKDMAQKFANPETYKALEQCVFAPNKEQQLENQQSIERKGKSW